jgi:hypothetical protein
VAACDTNTAVNQASGANFAHPALSISTGTTVLTTYYDKLVTANDVCPIQSFELLKADGSAYTDNKIALATQTVSGKKQP